VIEHIHAFDSKDSSYVALQGELNRKPVNVRVSSTAIDDLDEVTREPTAEQHRRFAQHNREAFATIAQSKIDRGDYAMEDWHGRQAYSVRVSVADIAEYVGHPENQLSFAAFKPEVQARWAERDGRF
jgi:hypothetical protein